MAQPSQESFTWHTAAMLGWLPDPELLIAISQNTYDPFIGITASTTIPTTGHCNLSLSRPPTSHKNSPVPWHTRATHYGKHPSSCSSCQPTASRPASTAPRKLDPSLVREPGCQNRCIHGATVCSSTRLERVSVRKAAYGGCSCQI
jgi:hypothetical protein